MWSSIATIIPMMQSANTPLLQSAMPGFHHVTRKLVVIVS